MKKKTFIVIIIITTFIRIDFYIHIDTIYMDMPILYLKGVTGRNFCICILCNWIFLLFCCLLLTYFIFPQIVLSGTLTEWQTVWIQIRTNIYQFGSRSGLTKSQSWSGSKLFAKVNSIWHQAKVLLTVPEEWLIYVFVCFVALHPKSTAIVMAGRSVHLNTLFSWAGLKQLTSTSCTYFRL